MAKVLFIDDDAVLTGTLADFLESEGFETCAVDDGRPGVEAALSGIHDLVVLDVMMPRMQGIDVLSAIRRASKLP